VFRIEERGKATEFQWRTTWGTSSWQMKKEMGARKENGENWLRTESSGGIFFFLNNLKFSSSNPIVSLTL
jgi:hypothetical protein